MMFISKVKMIEGERVDIHDIRIIPPSDYEKLTQTDDYKYRLHITCTDGFNIGYVLGNETSRRDFINILRDMANQLEEKELTFMKSNWSRL